MVKQLAIVGLFLLVLGCTEKPKSQTTGQSTDQIAKLLKTMQSVEVYYRSNNSVSELLFSSSRESDLRPLEAAILQAVTTAKSKSGSRYFDFGPRLKITFQGGGEEVLQFKSVKGFVIESSDEFVTISSLNLLDKWLIGRNIPPLRNRLAGWMIEMPTELRGRLNSLIVDLIDGKEIDEALLKSKFETPSRVEPLLVVRWYGTGYSDWNDANPAQLLASRYLSTLSDDELVSILDSNDADSQVLEGFTRWAAENKRRDLFERLSSSNQSKMKTQAFTCSDLDRTRKRIVQEAFGF